jgi:hypothetical protein
MISENRVDEITTPEKGLNTNSPERSSGGQSGDLITTPDGVEYQGPGIRSGVRNRIKAQSPCVFNAIRRCQPHQSLSTGFTRGYSC